MAFVDALVKVHPDTDQPGAPDSPWGDGPLLARADGMLAYFGVRPEQVDELVDLVEETAKRMDLVAYDPQLSQLLPSATTVARWADFELPAPDDLPLHLSAVMGEALNAGKTLAGILEQVETGFYVQWMAADGSLVIEVQGEGTLPPQHRLPDERRHQMVELGFVSGDPNWRLEWADGAGNLDQAGRILGRVLTTVRQLPVGTPMALQTFPV
ncbi:MAG: TY-Chap domain-containing protein [Acidimicrobiales bacterium]